MMLAVYLSGECPVLTRAQAEEALARLRILFALDGLQQLLRSGA